MGIYQGGIFTSLFFCFYHYTVLKMNYFGIISQKQYNSIPVLLMMESNPEIVYRLKIIKNKDMKMIDHTSMLAFMGIGPTEMLMIGIVGLLIFGNRLPEVGRGLGKGITEFKKGLKGIQDEIDTDDNNEKGNG